MKSNKLIIFCLSFTFFVWLSFASDNTILTYSSWVTWLLGLIYVLYSSFTLFDLAKVLHCRKIYLLAHLIIIIFWLMLFQQNGVFGNSFDDSIEDHWIDFLIANNSPFTNTGRSSSNQKIWLDENTPLQPRHAWYWKSNYTKHLWWNLLMLLFVLCSIYLYKLVKEEAPLHRIKFLLIWVLLFYLGILLLEFSRIFIAPFFAIYYALLWFYAYKRKKLSITHD